MLQTDHNVTSADCYLADLWTPHVNLSLLSVYLIYMYCVVSSLVIIIVTKYTLKKSVCLSVYKLVVSIL